MLELRQVHKSFDGVAAIRGVDLEVQARETLALIGESGCGKSTLLRMWVGLVEPDGGDVIFDGEPLDRGNLQALRLRMGYVIQEGGLFPHLSARDNTALMARQLGWPADRIAARVEVLRELTRLPAAALGRYPGELSGGQRQRVSLMRALMLDPDVLLLDEPLGALDPITRSELQRELREIVGQLGKTAVLVTHDLFEADFLGDRVALMREGEIVQQGTLDQLIDKPSEPFVARFIEAQQRPTRRETGATR
ncbi:MAG: ATP-binding cassette domain-containing protein [Myxococcales bacterium]|nr:ATP-binding cassette domain-containing protein [Myxococcales bacterium]